ncbi:MAG: ABC transporter permease, partial [Xanthomonadales bacterium]|nr:ABC transporter permease [Xanthomonadales bacterium]
LYPVILVGILALSLGASLFLCSLVVFLSDLNYIWGVFCRLLFFLTPVFFSAEIAGDGLARWVLELNPLTRLIHISREALLYGGQVPVGEVGLALLGPALVLLLGLVVFRASRAKIPDYI